VSEIEAEQKGRNKKKIGTVEINLVTKRKRRRKSIKREDLLQTHHDYVNKYDSLQSQFLKI
jgi:hypothetical protein